MEREILEIAERVGLPPGPPPPPISRDDWWQLRKEFQEWQAAMRAREEEQARLRSECDRRLESWRIATIVVVGVATGLLGAIVTLLAR